MFFFRILVALLNFMEKKCLLLEFKVIVKPVLLRAYQVLNWQYKMLYKYFLISSSQKSSHTSDLLVFPQKTPKEVN